MADEMIEIRWSSGSLDEARKVSRFLVQERLIAAAQIIPWLESIYLLDNQLETTQESQVIFKTRADLFDKIKEVILKNSRYEVPEITFSKIEGGNQSYLNWLSASITSHR
jgi:periplasmic divalent cation tolerance protein